MSAIVGNQARRVVLAVPTSGAGDHRAFELDIEPNSLSISDGVVSWQQAGKEVRRRLR